MRSHFGSIFGYGLSVATTAIVTLLAVPIVINHSGASAWASIALGQAVGTGFGILVSYGWGTTGPTEVAKAAVDARPRIFLESFRARLVLAIPAIVIAIAVTFAISSSYKSEAALTAAAFTLTGLLSGWFFTGSAKPFYLLLFDTGPRVVGTALGGVAMLTGAKLIVFPLLQLFGVLLAVLLSSGTITEWKRASWKVFPGSTILRSLRGQSDGIVIAGISAAYTTLPITVVALIAPAALPAYALADKILRFSTTAFAPVVQFLQGWVPGALPTAMYRRIRIAFLFGVVATLLAGTAFAIALPWFSHLLSRGQVILGASISVAFGLVLVFLIMEQVTGLVGLLALGRGQKLALFTCLGLVVAIPGILVGAELFGAAGAAWALALSEFVALVPQVALLALALRAAESLERSTAG